MISQVNIRQPDMAGQIHALQQAAYTIESQLIGYPDLPPLRETRADLQHSEEQFLIYREEGQIAGAVSYLRLGDTLDICRLVVSPAYFRRGVAGKLLEAVETGEPGIRQITVSTAEKNLPAVTLYQKHGYQVARRTVLADGLVLVELRKQIGEVD
jgi:ribosomal protein S18 acetylase RimI-like enzyme